LGGAARDRENKMVEETTAHGDKIKMSNHAREGRRITARDRENKTTGGY
jgi:hypothetical protein